MWWELGEGGVFDQKPPWTGKAKNSQKKVKGKRLAPEGKDLGKRIIFWDLAAIEGIADRMDVHPDGWSVVEEPLQETLKKSGEDQFGDL